MTLFIVAAAGFLATQIPFGPWEIFHPSTRLPSPMERLISTVVYPDNLPALRVRFHTRDLGFSLQGSTTPSLDQRDASGALVGSVRYSFVWLAGSYFHRFRFQERDILAVLEPQVLYEGIGPDAAVALAVGGGFRTRMFPRVPLDAVLYAGPLGGEVYSRFSRSLSLSPEALLGMEFSRPTTRAHFLLRLASQSGVGAGALWWPHPQFGVGLSFRSWLRDFSTGSGGDILAGLGAHARFRIRGYEIAYSWLSLGVVGDAHALGIRFLTEN